jgi:pimeloyl-ACP methyl ester carboxylesterase
MNDVASRTQSPVENIANIEHAAERRTTAAGGVEIVWHIWGSGEPLVLLHGGTGSWMHWIRNVEPLARDFRVVVPDLPGSGDSGTPTPPVSAEGVATTLRAGLDIIIGPQTRFALAGFSMGGLISGYLAKASGSLTRTLALVGASGMEGTRAPMEPLVSWRRLPTEEQKRATHRKNLGILMIHDPAKIDEVAVEAQRMNAERSRVRGKHVSHTGALSRCLPGFAGRLAGIWGEHDPTAAPHLDERRERLRSFQPAATFDVVPGAGHWVQYEAHEWFNRRMRELLGG